MVTASPEHIKLLLAIGFSVGLEFVIITAFAELVHPNEFDPTT
jgi:hypothetical protein